MTYRFVSLNKLMLAFMHTVYGQLLKTLTITFRDMNILATINIKLTTEIATRKKKVPSETSGLWYQLYTEVSVLVTSLGICTLPQTLII